MRGSISRSAACSRSGCRAKRRPPRGICANCGNCCRRTIQRLDQLFETALRGRDLGEALGDFKEERAKQQLFFRTRQETAGDAAHAFGGAAPVAMRRLPLPRPPAAGPGMARRSQKRHGQEHRWTRTSGEEERRGPATGHGRRRIRRREGREAQAEPTCPRCEIRHGDAWT